MDLCSEKHNIQHPDDNTAVLVMLRMKLRRWFAKYGGRLKKRGSKPILTPERKIKRYNWSKTWASGLNIAEKNGKPLYVCFLDEKWFYTRSGRKKAKWLNDVMLPTVRDVDRRKGKLVMFMAVISPPCYEHDPPFGGKILLLRVSKNVPAQRASYHRNFSFNVVEMKISSGIGEKQLVEIRQ